MIPKDKKKITGFFCTNPKKYSVLYHNETKQMLTFMIINEEFWVFRLLVGQKRQSEDVS